MAHLLNGATTLVMLTLVTHIKNTRKMSHTDRAWLG